MADTDFDRVRENRARRAAARQGLTLAKIQRRDRRALGWNRWKLRGRDGVLLLGDEDTGADLAEVEAYLRGEADGNSRLP